jgi:hypothetical protein
MGYAFMLLLIALYLIYGIVHVLRDKSLNVLTKCAWIIFIIALPVLGTSGYFRTNFKERHGEW